MRSVLPALAGLLLGLAAAVPAQADAGLATSSLNMRAGPGTRYPVVATIPRGGEVEILGCLDDYLWCDVRRGDMRGWASAGYLAIPREGGTRLVPKRSPDLPTVSFAQRTYWDRHYRNRTVYQGLSRWEERHSTRTNRLTDGGFGRYERPTLPSQPGWRADRPPPGGANDFRSRVRPPAFSRGGPYRGAYDSRGGWRGFD